MNGALGAEINQLVNSQLWENTNVTIPLSWHGELAVGG
jgi:hypothetical protein